MTIDRHVPFVNGESLEQLANYSTFAYIFESFSNQQMK